MSDKISVMYPVDYLSRWAKRNIVRYFLSVSFLFFCASFSLLSVDFIKDDFDLALTKAKIEEKPLMVFFYTDWCGWCKAMDDAVFADQTMSDYSSKKLISVRVNVEKKKNFSLAKKYRVRSYPTVLFVDPLGNEIHRINGFLPPKSFLKMTQTVVEIYNSSK